MQGPLLEVEGLETAYGQSQVLFGVSLRIARGQVATLLGRNGMGKTTLCNAITGLVPASGSVRLAGEEILGLPAHLITERGVGYVPQGRRVWPSLSVDEHLRLAAGGARGPWTVARVYEIFPRLAERRRNGGAELSGGEQQMLAIARALLTNPSVLLMDEPTEGLAPVIVQALARVLSRLRAAGGLSIVLVEQNSRVALDFSERTVVMDKGRIVYDGASERLRADPEFLASLVAAQ